MQAHFSGKPGRVPELGNLPPLSVGNCHQRARLFQSHQGQRSCAAYIGNRHCFHMGKIIGERKLAK